jgi:hypothetical protein
LVAWAKCCNRGGVSPATVPPASGERRPAPHAAPNVPRGPRATDHFPADRRSGGGAVAVELKSQVNLATERPAGLPDSGCLQGPSCGPLRPAGAGWRPAAAAWVPPHRSADHSPFVRCCASATSCFARVCVVAGQGPGWLSRTEMQRAMALPRSTEYSREIRFSRVPCYHTKFSLDYASFG